MRESRGPASFHVSAVTLLATALLLQPAWSQPRPKPKVAAVLPSRPNDLSWTQALHEGLKRLEQEGRIEYAFTEEVEPAVVERVLRRLAERSPDLIIAHSATYRDAVFKVAREFPALKFAWSSFGTRDTEANLAAYDTPIWEASYLAGEVAAHVTRTGKLGFVGGLALPGCRAILNAFRDGAQRARPTVEVTPAYVGTFLDIAKAKALALSLSDRGVDVISTCGNGPARGVIEAMRERNAWAVGYVYDMARLAPGNVLGSLVWDGYAGTRQMIDDLANNTFLPGKYYAGSARDGITTLKLNAAVLPVLPPAAIRAYEQALGRLKAGELNIPISFE